MYCVTEIIPNSVAGLKWSDEVRVMEAMFSVCVVCSEGKPTLARQVPEQTMS